MKQVKYRILGTSFTTGQKKWFAFYGEDQWQAFKKRKYTHYPAWSFDETTTKKN